MSEANDGMLHAFNASNGTGRRWPTCRPSVYKNLSATDDAKPFGRNRRRTGGPSLSRSTDRPPSAMSIYGGAWHTLLAGGAGRGRAGHLCPRCDQPQRLHPVRECQHDRALGIFRRQRRRHGLHLLEQPILVKTNNGRWSVIVGNGYNNSEDDGQLPAASGHAVLFVLDAETGAVRAKIDTALGQRRRPRTGCRGRLPIDTNGDGVADCRVCRRPQRQHVEVQSGIGEPWSVECRLRRHAALLARRGQPITVRPDVTKFTRRAATSSPSAPVRYIDTSDGSSTSATQAFYGIRDTGCGRRTVLASLVRQSVVSSSATGADSNIVPSYDACRRSRRRSTTALSGDNTPSRLRSTSASKKGWYHQPPGQSGERVVSDANIRVPAASSSIRLIPEQRSVRLRRHAAG